MHFLQTFVSNVVIKSIDLASFTQRLDLRTVNKVFINSWFFDNGNFHFKTNCTLKGNLVKDRNPRFLNLRLVSSKFFE